jgi:hypothetical protein
VRVLEMGMDTKMEREKGMGTKMEMEREMDKKMEREKGMGMKTEMGMGMDRKTEMGRKILYMVLLCNRGHSKQDQFHSIHIDLGSE